MDAVVLLLPTTTRRTILDKIRRAAKTRTGKFNEGSSEPVQRRKKRTRRIPSETYP
jgi:hypothetical protein